MEAFEENLLIVKQFACRVELYGDRDAVVASLSSRRLDEAIVSCAHALAVCRQKLEAEGVSPREWIQVPRYRRLLQLGEMIADLADTMHQNQVSRTGKGRETAGRFRAAMEVFTPPPLSA